MISEVGFYHLTRSTLDQALPQLLARTLAVGQRAVVLGPNTAVLDRLSMALWAQPAWLPHGTTADGDADLQPIWLTTEADPLNGGRFLFLVEGTVTDRLATFNRVFDLFDGNDPAMVTLARSRWAQAKAEGHILTYWQQTESSWQKKL